VTGAELIDALVQARLVRGLTQEGLAEATGWKWKWVAAFELGDVDPTLTDLLAYAAAVGVRVEVVPVASAD
jgi:predicted transcriptional regulator